MRPLTFLTLAAALSSAMAQDARAVNGIAGTSRSVSEAVHASLATAPETGQMPASTERRGRTALSPARLCHALQTYAEGRNLPVQFFVRLIWQESRFDHTAVSKRGAQGIAQFMPQTAKQWGLHDPFDPAMSLRKSAELLAYLTEKFGNVGLAAAAYNAGPVRVRNWLKGKGTLPRETLDYVSKTTGRPAQDWRDDITDVREMDADIDPKRGGVYSYTLEDWCLTLAAKVRKDPWPRSAWNVRVAEDVSGDEALRRVKRLNERLHGPARDTRPLLDPLDKAERDGSPRFAVDIAAETRKEAWALCSIMRKRGEGCRILRG